MTFTPDQLLDTFNQGARPSGLAVAFSGGSDSSVLLHALTEVRDQLPAPLRAIHINHGLQAEAKQWARHCEQFATARDVAFSCATVHVAPDDPRGLEAAARAARYDTFSKILRPDEWLLTAHHADDQLETVLLQLLRGGGPAGIAGMPLSKPLGVGWLVRPLLRFGRDELVAWARANHLDYVDDPSNADRQRDRNFLRHDIIPLLKTRWPSAASTASRAARHAAGASTLLNDLAASDLAQLELSRSGILLIKPVLALGQQRAENLLRHWLRCRKLPVPDTRRLDELLKQAASATADRVPKITWPGVEAHCWRGHIYAFPPLGEPLPLPTRWHGEPLSLGAGLGELRTIETEGGLRTSLFEKGVELRWRQGGEHIVLPEQKHHRKVKDLLREADIEPWMRSRIPLLWYDDKLVAVADLWMAKEYVVPKNERGFSVAWGQV